MGALISDMFWTAQLMNGFKGCIILPACAIAQFAHWVPNFGQTICVENIWSQFFPVGLNSAGYSCNSRAVLYIAGTENLSISRCLAFENPRLGGGRGYEWTPTTFDISVRRTCYFFPLLIVISKACMKIEERCALKIEITRNAILKFTSFTSLTKMAKSTCFMQPPTPFSVLDI